MFNPKISIIIPVYNGVNYMREAIDSAIAQTYENKEIIVINDGSTDEGQTLAIARSYGDQTRVIDKPNGGVATALNAGIAAMQGEYFSWLSHDDVYPIDKLEKQVAFLQTLEDKNTILFGDYTIINEKSEFMGKSDVSVLDTKNMMFELFAFQYMHGCTLLVPKNVFDQVGDFPTHLPTTQDYDLWVRASLQFPFAYVPGIFTHSRQHAEQGSRTLTHRKELIGWYLNHLTKISPEWLDARYEKEEIEAKYKILLQKFSNLGLWPVFIRVLNQAQRHLSFQKTLNSVCFLIVSLIRYYQGFLKGAAIKMIPLKIKNMLRKNLNAPQKQSGPSNLDFIHIYKKNIFGSRESISGSGSTMRETTYIREVFPSLFKELEVKTLLDVPCGDFNWMRHVDLEGIHYIGGDIVPQLIADDNEKYGSDTINFRLINIIKDDLPKADVILCRDCLVHLNFEDGMNAIRNFKKSGSKYLLSTTFTDRDQNEDLFGIWRTLNLQKAPYNLPKPLKIINEKCPQKGFGDKSLGLWRLDDIEI
ncbi:MAG: glycosyltransferase [Alphaproteobacteria bacterium]|nr:glycosyltransferase [Alphaproteobacteria bacterium]NCQ87668.1 glycosyltransferase [Alphaproteobacteria bacterium]NCT05823.1 glycosyltransferase [Alphaproteobacteria bacterium]